MMKINTALVISMLLIATPVFAKPDVSLVLQAKKIVEVKGKKSYVDAAKATPGDVLEYTIKVFNKGDSPALKLSPVGNIPPGTVYIPEKFDLNNYNVLYSIDYGKTYQESPTIKVTEKGKVIEKKAPVSMYNKIKWIFKKGFNSKQTTDLVYKVKVK